MRSYSAPPLAVAALATAWTVAAARADDGPAAAIERVGCPSRQASWSQKALLPIVKGPSFEGVVLPAKAAAAVLCQCSRGSLGLASGYWTPAAKEISEMEARFPNYLRAHGPPGQWRQLPKSLRQYLGVERAGRRLIYVNVLGGSLFSPERRITHPAIERSWRSTAAVMCDGGPDFFGAEYDVTPREFTRLDFNS